MRRLILLSVLSVAVTALAQQRGAPTIPRPPFGDGPFMFDTAEQHKIRVVVVTKGLSHPWGLAFLPDGSMLVTERAGRIRLVKDGVLDPNPIPGVPKVFAQQLSDSWTLRCIRGSRTTSWSTSRIPSLWRRASRRRSREGRSMVMSSPIFAISLSPTP